MSFLISTTGAGAVLLRDLGYRQIIAHPTVNLDLIALGFTIDAINKSQDLRYALGNNPTPKLTATYNGNPVSANFDVISDKLDKNNNLSDLTNLAQARTNLGLGNLAVLDEISTLDGGTP